MKKRRMTFAAVIAAITAALTLAGTTALQPRADAGDTKEKLEVHFIDVGQGDATLITCGGEAMLIDTGDDSKGTLLQNYLQKQGIKRLDYLVLTHPDSDHIGGAPVILTKFQVDTVFVSDYEKDNKTYRKLIQAMDDKGLDGITPQVGSSYTLGGASFTILAPNQTYEDPNNASIALLLQNGSNRFLFTGDAEEKAEQDILENGIPVRADVYQAGHHGSRTSSSEAFLDAVQPAYAVVSCEEGNSYGHPHAQTLNALRSRGIKLFRTDEQGSIIAISDGSQITWNCAPTETWQAGEPTGSAASSTGSTAAADQKSTQNSSAQGNEISYVLNTKSRKFHLPSCDSLPTENRQDVAITRDEVIEQGYTPCKRCNP